MDKVEFVDSTFSTLMLGCAIVLFSPDDVGSEAWVAMEALFGEDWELLLSLL